MQKLLGFWAILTVVVMAWGAHALVSDDDLLPSSQSERITNTPMAPRAGQTNTSAVDDNEPHEDIPVVLFNARDLMNPTDWKTKFDVIVVIDKSPHVQRAYIYRYGQFVRAVRISTGRDRVEFPNPQKEGAYDSLTHETFSHTYSGYYTPLKLDIDHISTTWKGVPMPWAVFFTHTEATHKGFLGAERKNETVHKHLSGGCVRMSEGDASDVFWWVRATGGPITPIEAANQHFVQELTDRVQAGDFPTALDSTVTIPVFNINGTLPPGQLRMRAARFRTLYIVEDTSAVNHL